MKTIVGNIDFVLDVKEDLAIRGSLRAGATVHDGCTLRVHGDMNGTLTIGRGSRVTLGGTLGAFVDRNDGALGVAGFVATPIETIPGELIVAANTAVTIGGRAKLLTADGNLTPILDIADIPVNESDGFRWHTGSSSFSPADGSQFEELAGLIWPGEHS